MGCHVLPEKKRIFTKILQPLLCTLHQQGHTAVAHIDELYLQGQTFKHVKNVIDTTVLFDKLGVLVNPDKSVFIPTQVITILGFVINLMTVQLTREKATGLKGLVPSCSQSHLPLLGKCLVSLVE